MENPQVRPGLVSHTAAMPRVVAFFRNAAQGNVAIQRLVALGVPSDRLGVTPPEQIEGGQGILLSISCPDARMISRAEDICRDHGADLHRRRS